MMNLTEVIYKRQSIRKYNNQILSEESLDSIRNFIDNSKVLNNNIKWSYNIVDSSKIKTIMNWKAPYYIHIYSQKKENYNENIGFIFQQLDLYLQSNDIGSCWIGVAKPKDNPINHNDHEYVISLAFGYSDEDIHRDIAKINRKSLAEISDRTDDKLDVVRVAPSAMNSQPWYFTHESDDTYNIYRKKQNMIKRRLLDRLNQIDIGIALAHIYISNIDSFKFNKNEAHEEINGYYYEGSFKI